MPKASDFKKGFTLVELLMVIAILAVLSSAVIVILNPGELLAEGRDAKRINELNTVYAALAVYVSQVPNADLGGCSAGGICTFDPGAGKGPFANTTCAAINAATNISGTGWVSADFTDILGGSPIASLPIDPMNSAIYFYAYMCSESPYVFELDTRLESQKYRGEMAFDSGDKNCLCGGMACTSDNIQNMTVDESTAANCFYEVGTAVGLSL
ncbi:MAG: type II secretion system protein [Parcubacteria group bacterium]